MAILYGDISAIYEGIKFFKSEAYGPTFVFDISIPVSVSVRVLLATAIR